MFDIENDARIAPLLLNQLGAAGSEQELLNLSHDLQYESTDDGLSEEGSQLIISSFKETGGQTIFLDNKNL